MNSPVADSVAFLQTQLAKLDAQLVEDRKRLEAEHASHAARLRAAIASFNPAPVAAPAPAPVVRVTKVPRAPAKPKPAVRKPRFNQVAALKEAIALQHGAVFTAKDLIATLAKLKKPVALSRVRLELWSFRTKAKPPLIEIAHAGTKGGEHGYRAVNVASAGSSKAAAAASPAKASTPASKHPGKASPKKSPGGVRAAGAKEKRGHGGEG